MADWRPMGIQAVQGANLAFFWAQVPLSVLNMVVLVRTSLLHPNLKFILLAQSAAFCAFAAARSAQIVITLVFGVDHTEDVFIVEIVLHISAQFQLIPGYVLIVERTIAIFRAKNYAQRRKPYFSLCWFLPTFTFDVLNSVQLVTRNSENREQTSVNCATMAATYILALLSGAEIIAFSLLNARNLKLQKSWLVANWSARQTLDQRYQLAENIRVAQQLSPVLILHCANVLAMLPFPLLVYYNLLQTPSSAALVFSIECLYMTLNNALIEYNLISRHLVLRRNARELLKSCVQRLRRCVGAPNGRVEPSSGANGSAQGNRSGVLESVQGTAMAPGGVQNDTELHFRMLQREWA